MQKVLRPTQNMNDIEGFYLLQPWREKLTLSSGGKSSSFLAWYCWDSDEEAILEIFNFTAF